jgi:universal stress protein A
VSPAQKPEPRRYETLLVPYDFSPHSRAALDLAVDLARRLGGRIELVHVLQPPSFAYPGFEGTIAVPTNLVELERIVEDALARVADEVRAPDVAVEFEIIEAESIAGTLCDVAARRGADLIVMGSHGRTGLAHVFLGSVAERTLRRAPCPVLTVRGEEEASAGVEASPGARDG